MNSVEKSNARLTISEYSRLFTTSSTVSNVAKSALSSEVYSIVHKDQIDREFRLIIQSEYLVENFVCLPKSVQRSVVKRLSQNCSVDHVDVLALVALQIHENSNLFDWDALTDGDLHSTLKMHLLSVAAKSEMMRFEDLVSDYVFQSVHLSSQGLIDDVMRMLAMLHGMPLMIEILQRWADTSNPVSIAVFVSVVENWDSVKDCPFEWIIHLVKGERLE